MIGSCTKPETVPSREVLYLYAFIYTMKESKEVRVQDMKDGTIKISTYKLTSNVFGMTPNVSEIEMDFVYLKRCLQGQVYRSSQNDCKGAGTQSDYWGAQKFQWCPTNDRACEISKVYTYNGYNYTYTYTYYSVDRTKSPPYISCGNDTTANRKWELTGVSYGDRQIAYYKYVTSQRIDEIPSGDTDYYWYNGSQTIDSSSVISLGGDYTYIYKNSYNYVLCYAY